MKKSNNSPGDEEDNFCELPNFQLKFVAGPPRKKFAELSEQELNQLVEQILEEDQENSKLVCINLSRLVMHSGNFRENFSTLERY